MFIEMLPIISLKNLSFLFFSCLKAEGIFRINAENSQEEYVRDQLNRGVVPRGIDVHSLAGLIKVRVLDVMLHRLQVLKLCEQIATQFGRGYQSRLLQDFQLSLQTINC